jgi:hypothetical protein
MDNASILVNGLTRQAAEEDLKSALEMFIIDLGYSPGDLTDEIRGTIEVIGEEYGIDFPYVKADVEFYGDDKDDKHATIERGGPGKQFPWERDSA